MDLMNHFHVSLVIHGRTSYENDVDGVDPYEVPKGLGKFQHIDSGNPMSTQDIITRIIDNRFIVLNLISISTSFDFLFFFFSYRLAYEKRNEAKEAKKAAADATLQKLKEKTTYELSTVDTEQQ